jgi:hypothetical protein
MIEMNLKTEAEIQGAGILFAICGMVAFVLWIAGVIGV